jgi:FAD/FMN-containing dehydrogenase
VAFQEKDISKAAEQSGLRIGETLPGVSARDLAKVLSKPSADPFWKLRLLGGCQDLLFLTTLDRVQGFMDTVYDIAEQNDFPVGNIGAYVQPMVQGTSCHCEFNFFHDADDAAAVEKVRTILLQAGDAVLKGGGFFSRPYGEMANMVYGKDGDTAAVLRKVKQIFDPNNIMNTGKLCFQ